MFWRMLQKSFTRGIRSKILAVITVAFGASLASAMFNVSLDIGDKVNKELKSYGANLLVQPKMDTLPMEVGGINFNPLSEKAFIREGDLPKLKTIFWGHNVVGFTPYLEASAKGKENFNLVGTWFNKHLELPTGEALDTGVISLKSWWKVKGSWPKDDNSTTALIGRDMAKRKGLKAGSLFKVRVNTSSGQAQDLDLTVTGILDSGGQDDNKVFIPLAALQMAVGMEGKVAKVEVSALTTPENELARKADKDKDSLTAQEFERWYCTAYVNAIAYQIEEAIPGVEAKAIRQVAESEGMILTKIQLLMALLTIAALISSVLGITSLMTTNVLERSKEIGLMKALGAEDWLVVTLFLTEAGLTGLLGGILGYLMGLGFAQIIASSVFGAVLTMKALVIPIVIVLAMAVTVIGSLSAMRMITRLRPAEVLRGGR